MNESILFDLRAIIHICNSDKTDSLKIAYVIDAAREAIKRWEDSPAGKTNFGEKYKNLTLKKREDSSGKETGMKWVSVKKFPEDNNSKNIRYKIRNEFIRDAWYCQNKIWFSSDTDLKVHAAFVNQDAEWLEESVPPYKEEEKKFLQNVADMLNGDFVPNQNKEEVDKDKESEFLIPKFKTKAEWMEWLGYEMDRYVRVERKTIEWCLNGVEVLKTMLSKHDLDGGVNASTVLIKKLNEVLNPERSVATEVQSELQKPETK